MRAASSPRNACSRRSPPSIRRSRPMPWRSISHGCAPRSATPPSSAPSVAWDTGWMNRTTESAPSIQRRLLWFLLPPLAVLMLAGVYANYRAATAFVESAYDERLGDTAVSLAGSVVEVDHRLRVDQGAVPATGHRADHLVALRYAIVSSDGEFLAGNSEVPAAAASVTANPTFADV